MRFALPALGALALLAAPAFAGDPEETQPAPAPATEKSEKAENEKICKYVRTDASSRRKTRICRTRQEWIDINRGN